MKLINKIVLCSAILFISSCALVNKSFKADDKPKIRIVDMQGNPHPVNMKTPALNMSALQEQGNLSEEKISSQRKNPSERDVVMSKNKYADGSYDQSNQALQSTLQMQQNPQMKNQIAKTQNQNQEYSEGQDISGTGQIEPQKEEMVEYDLAAEKPVKSELPKEKISKKSPNKKQRKALTSKQSEPVSEELPASKNKKGLFVQAGSFTTMQHAKNQVEQIKKYSENNNVSIQEAKTGDKIVFRVVVGPFNGKQKATAMVEHLEASGHKSIIIRNK